MDGMAIKSERLLQIYSQLVSGDALSKKELAQRFCVTERSIQRDMESLRCFFAEQGLRQDILYDRQKKGYRLEQPAPPLLSNSEILAVCKILLESRSMRKDEMLPILDKLISCCVPERSRRAVSELLANEKLHYIEPHHGQRILPGLWEIGQAVQRHQVLEIEYERMKDPKLVRPRESSVEETLLEMYLAGSVRRVENITEALWGSKVSLSPHHEPNKKAYGHIEDWWHRPLQGGLSICLCRWDLPAMQLVWRV